VKGGHVFLEYDQLIVTSNFRIEEVYPDQKYYDAIKRRFDVYVED